VSTSKHEMIHVENVEMFDIEDHNFEISDMHFFAIQMIKIFFLTNVMMKNLIWMITMMRYGGGYSQ